RDKSITDIENKLNEYTDFDLTAQLQLLDLAVELRSQIRALNRTIAGTEKSIKQHTQDKKASDKTLNLLKGDQCPYCLQQFADNEHKIAECNTTIADADAAIKALTVEYEKQLDELDKL